MLRGSPPAGSGEEDLMASVCVEGCGQVECGSIVECLDTRSVRRTYL